METTQLSLFGSNEENKKIITAADIFQSFFLTTFIPMKLDEKRISEIKKEVKSRFSNDSRKRIERKNVVIKWRVVKKYETNFLGLNELLYDHGLLHVIRIPSRGLDSSVKDQLEPFKLPTEKIVVPNTNNKRAKMLMNDIQEFLAKEYETEKLLTLFRHYYRLNESRKSYYNEIKKQMLVCPVLNKERKLSFDFGTITLRDNHKGYDMEKVIAQLGVDFVLAHGKPDMQELEYFIDRGIIDRKEIEKFRIETDRRLDFMLMTKEAEEKQQEVFQKKMEQKIKRSMQK